MSLRGRRVFLGPETAALCAVFLLLLIAAGCGSSSPIQPPVLPTYVVNSTDDVSQPPSGTNTLRSILSEAPSGNTVTFDSSLD